MYGLKRSGKSSSAIYAIPVDENKCQPSTLLLINKWTLWLTEYFDKMSYIMHSMWIANVSNIEKVIPGSLT